jgi:integrase
VKLTPISVANAKPTATRREIPDGSCRGLYLVVQPSGRQSWAVRYRIGGKSRKLTLAGFPPLAEARKAAAEALLAVARGKDPAAIELGARVAAANRHRDTVDRLAVQFIEQYARRHTGKSYSRQTEGMFRRIILPAWTGRPVHDITRRDVIELLEMVAADRPIMANRTKAVLSKFFGWLAGRDVIPASPCVGVAQPSKERPRDRVLSDDESRRLWLACEALSDPAKAFIRLLILTGQRRGEIAGLRRDEVDGDSLALSAQRMKGRQAHVVPLSVQAAAIIASLPRGGPYVFGKSPVDHFARVKHELDSHMGATPPWVLHDIRRSTASSMAKLGVPVPVIEKILAHRSGTFRGVVGTYQRHSFLPEMAAALQRWADHVEAVARGKPTSKVVRFGRR